MDKTKVVETTEECFICGDTMSAITAANQDELCDAPDCEDNHTWHALDGDAMTCLECGSLGWFSTNCSDGDGYMNYDEMSEHNVKCAEEYEKKQG